jgi:hypothetical protein
VNTSVPHSIEEVTVTGGRDIFVSEETVPLNAVEQSMMTDFHCVLH